MGDTTSQTVKVFLELVPEDLQNPDPASIGAVAREIADNLRRDGYTINPAYTGQKGGNLFEVVQQLGQSIQSNKEFLTVLFGLATPIAQYLLKERDHRSEKEHTVSENQSIKVTVAVDGASIAVETPDIESAAKLANVFRLTHPDIAVNTTIHSVVKVSGSVPQRQPRRRR